MQKKTMNDKIFKNPRVIIGGKEVKTVPYNITIEEMTMIIVFDGNPLLLEKKMREWSGKTTDSTEKFISKNFIFYAELAKEVTPMPQDETKNI